MGNNNVFHPILNRLRLEPPVRHNNIAQALSRALLFLQCQINLPLFQQTRFYQRLPHWFVHDNYPIV